MQETLKETPLVGPRKAWNITRKDKGRRYTGQVVRKARRRKEGRHEHMLPPSIGQIWHSRIGHSSLD